MAIGCACGVTADLHAKVWPIEDTWRPLGTTTLVTTTASYDNGDGIDDPILLADGAGPGEAQGLTFDFRGELVSGETVSVSINLVNPNPVECRLVVEFYNVTDARVIKVSPEVVLAPNSTRLQMFNMSASASDAGDRLQLRFIRSDDGAANRDFAIDSVVFSDYFLPGPSYHSKTPDLPMEPFDPELQTDMDGIIDTWYDNKLLPSSPEAISAAETAYNNLNIVNSDGKLTGNIDAYSDTAFISRLGAALLDDPDQATWIEMVNNTVKLVAQNLLRGIISLDTRGYQTRDFLRQAVLLKDFLDQGARDSFNYVLHRSTDSYGDFWKADYPGPVSQDTIDTDQIYNYSDSLLIFAIGFQRTPEEAQRWVRGVKRYCDRFATPSRGTSNGIKVDGSGFHHWSNYERYMYSYRTFIEVIDAMSATRLQLETENYLSFRDAVMAQFVRSRDLVKALALSDRNPTDYTISLAHNNLKQLALAGGRILGLETADPEVAAFYNYIFIVDPDFGVTEINPMEGAFQFNYAHMGIYRRNGWTATMRGLSSYFWGTETYKTENRYGRYQSYGALQVVYEGGAVKNGMTAVAWDWNFAPGTTTIVLPWTKLHAERERIDESQIETFVGFGTLNNRGSVLLNKIHGQYGVFGMKFRQKTNQGFGTVYGPNTHNGTFVFRKSTFVFDDIIIALGSDIANNDTSNKTVTTLYQRSATDRNPIVVNGIDYTSTRDVYTFNEDSSRWVLDRLNTGYYVPPSNDDLVLERGVQTSPPESLNDPSNVAVYNSGLFAKVYLDHGTNPAGADYEYVTIPSTTEETMAVFATAMEGPESTRPYRVMAKDAAHHVVKYQDGGKEVWGLALFEDVATMPDGCVVRSNAGPSLVLYERHGEDRLTLSVTDPDLGLQARSYAPAKPSTVVLDLAGYWIQASSNPDVLAHVNPDGTTTLTFDLIDGMPAEIQLVRDGFATWLEQNFSEAEREDPNISGPQMDPDLDRTANVFEFIHGSDPWGYDDVSGFQIGANSSNIEILVSLTENLAGCAVQVDESPDLEAWVPVLQITDGINDSFTLPGEGYSIEQVTDPRSVIIRPIGEEHPRFLRLTAAPR